MLVFVSDSSGIGLARVGSNWAGEDWEGYAAHPTGVPIRSDPYRCPGLLADRHSVDNRAGGGLLSSDVPGTVPRLPDGDGDGIWVAQIMDSRRVGRPGTIAAETSAPAAGYCRHTSEQLAPAP